MFHKYVLVVFVDFLFLLCLAFLFISQTEANKEKSVVNKQIPTVYIYLEMADGEPRARCNEHIVSPYELAQIIKLAPEKGVNSVQADFFIEGEIKYKFIHRYVMAVKSIEMEMKNKEIKAGWDTLLVDKVR